jgi:hypothetical protein
MVSLFDLILIIALSQIVVSIFKLRYFWGCVVDNVQDMKTAGWRTACGYA